MVELLGISGSLRAESYCTAILKTLADSPGDMTNIRLFPLHDLPLYNEDLESLLPPAVTVLRNAIAAADGIVIVSPEYNHGMPGVLKNALDWASRPFGRAAISGRPVLAITASVAFTGGVRAHAQLNETLIAMACQLVVRPQSVVGGVHDKVTGGRLTDQPTLYFLRAGIGDLVQLVIASGAGQRAEASRRTHRGD
ncbi:NADPH-dependent FMN reductase [Sphingomonas sp. SRS2]|uniref:NADPH-dependent FMN reductase n=1 Tax=Sphingomonas sp. SRS2 TaxID=133190 RepID=UPI0006183F4C|nr:NADPH-dependent FMN reductase [Sphingomonas sp. SRS2]KKC26727.1 hypothetical protein WP12_07245 [Sphingomonas sp. SRS2]